MMRKKKCNQSKSEPCLSERFSQFCNEFQKASNQLEFIANFFGLKESLLLGNGNRNEVLKVIAFCKNKGVQKILLELGDKGADVVAIYNYIKVPELHDYELKRLPQAMRQDVMLHPRFNEMIKRAAKGQKEFKKRERALRGAIKLVCDLKPIEMSAVDALRKYHPDFNERLAALQKEFEDVVNLYIEHVIFFSNKAGEVSGYIASNWAKPISKVCIPKEVTSKSNLWNHKIVSIVDELKRIGFSAKQAYKKTMDLFTLAFPEIWNDNDSDLIRQRYTYHKKPKNNKSPAM